MKRRVLTCGCVRLLLLLLHAVLAEALEGIDLGETTHKKPGTTVPESIHSFSELAAPPIPPFPPPPLVSVLSLHHGTSTLSVAARSDGSGLVGQHLSPLSPVSTTTDAAGASCL